MNSTQHDELAALFAQRMQLTTQPPNPAAHSPSSQTPDVTGCAAPGPERQPDPPIHFVSSHYTHTGHIRPATALEPLSGPPPSYQEAIMPEALADVLRQHSIDPFALLPNQIHLFTNADYEQRLRLLELWRIAPPSYPLEERRYGSMTATNLVQEEAQAKLRYEQRMEGRRVRSEQHMFDVGSAEYASPVQPAEAPLKQMDAEPYILQGYEDMRPSRSADPVYAAASNLWQAPNYALALQKQQEQQRMSAMEDQYGMAVQIRNHADWERLNQRIASQTFATLHGSVDTDDKMVM